MKVLILGAGGQVGRALVAAAPAKATVIAVERAGCDITDVKAASALITGSGAGLVFNAAAYTAVDRAEAEPEQARRLNAAAPAQLAAAAAAAGAGFVHISTDYVFDGTGGVPYLPGASTNPLNVYGRTKREGEVAVLAAAQDALIVRTAWVYAARGSNFLNTMLRLMRDRDRLSVVADQVGTPTHAASLAAASWSLAMAKARGIHHFTDAGVASWYDFAVAIGEEACAAGLLAAVPAIDPVRTVDFPGAARRPAYSVLDKSATWAALGAPPPHWRVNLRTSLGALLARG